MADGQQTVQNVRGDEVPVRHHNRNRPFFGLFSRTAFPCVETRGGLSGAGFGLTAPINGSAESVAGAADEVPVRSRDRRLVVRP